MRAVVEGTLLACGKTRVWSSVQERKANQVLARGIRRCLGLDVFNMREFGYSDERLRHMVQWNSFSELMHRQVLNWVGHVARMPADRLPKIALFGWPAGLETRSSGKFTYPRWAQWVLQKYGISVMDWFRLAQKPTRNWVRIVVDALPRSKLSAKQVKLLNAWQHGDSLLQWASPAHAPGLQVSPFLLFRLVLFLVRHARMSWTRLKAFKCTTIVFMPFRMPV